MNVTLPENKVFSKRQLIIYAVIIFICVISIIVAFYVQFYARIDLGKFIGLGEQIDDLRVFDLEKYVYGLFKEMM